MDACFDCGFELWIPIAPLRVSSVGLYDDSRFPGRLLVVLNQHFDHLDELEDDMLADFISDVRLAARILRKDMGADRVNVAVLGNEVSHVHAHVIPRSACDPVPTRPPWEDPRAEAPLSRSDRARLLGRLSSSFDSRRLDGSSQISLDDLQLAT